MQIIFEHGEHDERIVQAILPASELGVSFLINTGRQTFKVTTTGVGPLKMENEARPACT